MVTKRDYDAMQVEAALLIPQDKARHIGGTDALLAEKFASPDHPGPKSVADFDELTDPEELVIRESTCPRQ